MNRLLLAGVALACLALPAAGSPLERPIHPGWRAGFTPPPDSTRLWGRVTLTDGAVLEGYLRWGHGAGVWADLLDGTRMPPAELVELARSLTDDAGRLRSVDYFGIRVSWPEDDFEVARQYTVRFGHLRRLIPDGEEVLLEFRSGERARIESGGGDLGPSFRGLEVEGRDGNVRELEWEEIAEVEFAVAPAGSESRHTRLHGSVTTTDGRRITGWVGWGSDEIFLDETLDGKEEDEGIAFEEISTIERLDEGVRVTLVSGEHRTLSGTEDVNADNAGIEVIDPELGRAVVPWRSFASFDLHPVAPDAARLPEARGVLHGVLVTEDGTRLEGRIVWDADEATEWEFLNGVWGRIDVAVEFSRILRIERTAEGRAELTLRDGRRMTLEGSNDVDASNRGILVLAADGTGEKVEWVELAHLTFEPR
ncbi:MAG: hypothetical protein RQ745_03375 [Longimicrobiales bacterium]|nr:hypothetical protein [Longimicrobiales bacterium]